jgi:hypothetical protein
MYILSASWTCIWRPVVVQSEALTFIRLSKIGYFLPPEVVSVRVQNLHVDIMEGELVFEGRFAHGVQSLLRGLQSTFEIGPTLSAKRRGVQLFGTPLRSVLGPFWDYTCLGTVWEETLGLAWDP